jgi:DNA-binding MarR family transcriptional regulator
MESQLDVDAAAVANALRPVLLRLARQLRRELHPLGVTAGQATLLFTIQKNPGIGVRALADGEGVSAPAISAHIARLERAGLVARTSGADRRRVGLTVTDDAARVLDQVRSRRTAWLDARLRTLAPDDRAAIEAAVGPLARLLEEHG